MIKGAVFTKYIKTQMVATATKLNETQNTKGGMDEED